jgi:hypothetical protein
MAIKFSVVDGGFLQDTSVGKNRIEFKVEGNLENPNLVIITAPAYSSTGMTISSATLAINNGQVGSFKVEVRSTNVDGTSSTTHISQTIAIASAGVQGLALTIGTAAIAATKVVQLYIQYVSGSVSSDISITLE